MVPSLNLASVVAVLLFGVFATASGFLIRRRWLDWRAARADPINLPAPRRPFPWLGIIIGVGGLTMILQTMRRPETTAGLGPAPEEVASGTVALSMFLPMLAVVAVVALVIVRRLRTPYARAVLRALRGDHDGGVAAVRAEMARHSAALPRPAAPGSAPSANPWAPPSIPTTDPQRRALARGWSALAAIEADRKDWLTALGYCEQAEQVDPANGPIYRGNRGVALVELGRAAEAIPLLRETVAVLPASASWHRSNVLTSLAQALIATGQRAEAGPVLSHALGLGRGALVFPRSAKRQWRTRIENLRAQLAAPPQRDSPSGSAASFDPGGRG